MSRSRPFPTTTLAARTLLGTMLLLAACSPGSPTATPGAATDAAGAEPRPVVASSPSSVPLCDPAREPGAAVSYPGWPVPGQAQMAAAIPILASSEQVVGRNRFLFTFVDDQNRPLAALDVAVEARFFDLAADPENPVVEVAGTYLDSGAGPGLYRASVDFGCAGIWGVELTVHLPDGVAVPRTIFDVQPTSTTPAVGAQAPLSDSPTAATPDEVAAISTDMHPDPDLYGMTIAQAVTSGRPAVIFFATPAFCQTAMCGPALERVKAVAADYRDRVVFVNVEPYQLQETPNGLQPLLSAEGQLQPVASVLEWGLRTEPYLFVIAADGSVAAKLEGPLDEAELRAELDAVLALATG